MIEYLLLTLGLFLLIKSADYLVDGASSLAKKLGISTLVIGLTIVAFGTSLPELIVSIFGSAKGTTDIVFGNIIGSNMANTLLVLGIIALFTSFKFKNDTVWKEIPFSFLAIIVLAIFATSTYLGNETNYLTRGDGLIMLMFFVIFMIYVYELTKKEKKLQENTNTNTKSNIKSNKKTNVIEENSIKEYSGRMTLLMIFIGLIGLFFGGKWTVDSAITIARNLGLSEFFISATIIAIGTSLPELITSIVAATKKRTDLAIGNILGSNIFNIFWVLGLSAIIRPLKFPEFIIIDLIILIVATMLVFMFMFTSKKNEIDKWEGITMLIFYALYILFLIFRPTLLG